MISMGPLHHGRKELQSMEDLKINSVRYFLGRTQVSLEDFLSLIKRKEAKLRNCYAETIPFDSDDFVIIILVDAVFLIESYLRGDRNDSIPYDDRIIRELLMLNCLWLDLWLVENQVPFFILDELFDLAKLATNDNYYEGLSFMTISSWFRKYVLGVIPLEFQSSESHFSEALHLLDWLRLCLQPSHKSHTGTEIERQNIPSAREFHQAGVKIQLESSKNLLDISFSVGILKIPFLDVYDQTESLFQNILIFEEMHGSASSKYFNDYIFLMSFLISTAKVAELLMEKEVIGHRSGEELSTIFQNLSKSCRVHQNFQYSEVVGPLQEHCKRPYKKWKVTLRQNYFHTPWASIFVIAAVTLLVLTLIQTTCSMIAL